VAENRSKKSDFYFLPQRFFVRIAHPAQVLIIIAMLSVENIISMPSLYAGDGEDGGGGSALHVQQTLAGFASPFGDHIMFLRIFQTFQGMF
jgi:hypothetical protein